MNWFNLRQDFHKFTNQLRMKLNQAIDKSIVQNTNVNSSNTNKSIKVNSNNNEQAPKKKHKSNNLYRSKENKNIHLKTFVDTI